jgi:hypothetical protein
VITSWIVFSRLGLVALTVLGCAPGEPSRECVATHTQPLVWELVDRITPPELLGFQGFGQAIALDGETAIITEWYGRPGTGYAYEHVDGGWTLTQELPQAEPEMFFGINVALMGDTALVGAPGANNGQGRAFVYRRNGGVWEEPQVLTPEPTQVSPSSFGASVALAGDMAAVSALYDTGLAGSVQLFRREGDVYTFEEELLAPDPENLGNFGLSIAMHESMLVVGAPGTDSMTSSNADVGAVYVFTHDGTSWNESAFLQPTDLTAKHRFGTSVAVDDEYVIAGGPGEPHFNGRVSVYRHDEMWANAAELPPPSMFVVTPQFGAGVERIGSSIAVAAPATLGSALIGRVFVYEPTGTTWTMSQTLVPDDASSGDLFGDHIAASGTTMLVSSPGADAMGFVDVGLVYEYSLGATLGEACGDDAECNSGHCADGVCCEQTCGVCQICDADGICRIAAAGEDPADECDEEAPLSCGFTGACDGRGSCAVYPDGSRCGAGECTGGRCRPECVDEGTLVVDEQGEDQELSCAPYRCSEGACVTSCATTAECLPGFVCTIDGACVAARAADVDHTGCRAAPGRERPWVLLLLALAFAGRRARRR